MRPGPNPKVQLIGRMNKAQGAHFERLIEQSCRYYKETGISIKSRPFPGGMKTCL